MTARKKAAPVKAVKYPTYKRATFHTLEPNAEDSICLKRDGDDPDVVVVDVTDGDGGFSYSGVTLDAVPSHATLRLTRDDWNRLTELFYRALGDETE